jgi:hypothetical protein
MGIFWVNMDVVWIWEHNTGFSAPVRFALVQQAKAATITNEQSGLSP